MASRVIAMACGAGAACGDKAASPYSRPRISQQPEPPKPSWSDGAGDGTYIGVVPDGLDGLIIKVTRVALHAGHLVNVLETIKDLSSDGELRGALSQLHTLLVVLGVDALDPVVVLGGILDVFLEDDHVAVRHLLGRGRRQHWGCVLVNRLHLEGRRCCGQSR